MATAIITGAGTGIGAASAKRLAAAGWNVALVGRRAALLDLGVRPRLAGHTAGSGLGPWYLARAKALSVGLSNAYFKSLGLPTLIDGF